MANSTLVGFTSTTNSNQCKEIQPLTTWTRDGNYQVTRRWVGPIDSLVNFSDGGSGNADSAGTYFSGATVSPYSPGGAGVDGAISVDLARDEGGLLGTLSVTWVSSSISSALGDPKAAGRTGTTGDQYQDSSLWVLDGNDLEKSIFKCPAMNGIVAALDSDHRDGFPGQVKNSLDKYLSGQDRYGNNIANYATTEFNITSYLPADEEPVDALDLAELTLLGKICKEYLKGVEFFPVSQFVLRNTVTAQYSSTVANQILVPFYANVNQIWSTTQLQAAMTAQTRPIDPPTNPSVAYTLPLIGVLGTIFSSSKWLYRTPDVQQLGNGKWQITREWWESTDFSDILYDVKP